MNIHSIRVRLTAWYAGLLAGAIVLFGVLVYVGLKQYLIGNAGATLAVQSRSIGTEWLAEFPNKRPGWLGQEINEAYAPEANSNFVRITKSDGTIIYVSGQPKDNSFQPSEVPLPTRELQNNITRIVHLPSGKALLIESLSFSGSGDTRFLVESGIPYSQIEDVLNGLLRMLAVYLPLIVSVAGFGGYWLMRRSLRPVDEITTRAEGITSTNLSQRLPVIKTGDEIDRLSTALNRMIARLEDAFQHIHRFSADASHELRTPLTILQLELEGIVQNPTLDPELVDQIGSALEETQRLSRIVESLLTISRLDAGEVKMEKDVIKLAELAQSTTEQMKLLADEKLLTMSCSCDASVYILGDKSRFKQVIVNLIANAIKYTPEGGNIGVSVRPQYGKALLEVFDDGVGIPSQAITHIFERFYRADKARSRDSGGAGLGLAIVKAICTAHGAEVKVSSHEGKGSSFTVEMPLARIPHRPETSSAESFGYVSEDRR
ncbi:MAG: sensor histidine kinase [Terriglobales bacterium]